MLFGSFWAKARGLQSAFYVGHYRERSEPTLMEPIEVSEFSDFLREKLWSIGGIDGIDAIVHDGSRSSLMAREQLLKEKPSLFRSIDTIYAANLLRSELSQLQFLKELYEKVTLVHEESIEHVGLWSRIEMQCIKSMDDSYAQRHAFIFEDDEYRHPIILPDPISLRCRVPQHFGASFDIFKTFLRCRLILQAVL